MTAEKLKIAAVDNYLSEGCYRCPLGGTPECKVHDWVDELIELRRIVINSGLKEELKWSVPCYTYNNKNVVIVSAFKNYASLSFFKGVLLKDPKKLLVKPGENSQSARLVKFTTIAKIRELEEDLNSLLKDAIEKAGRKVKFKESSEINLPEAFQEILENDQQLKTAFEALTPGRQRGYLIYFSQAKQDKTIRTRIEKSIPAIMNGKGWNER